MRNKFSKEEKKGEGVKKKEFFCFVESWKAKEKLTK